MKRIVKTDSIEVVVDGTEFISVFRVLRKMFPGGIPDVHLTVDHGFMNLDFPNGGFKIRCNSRRAIVAQIPGKTVRRIATAYGVGKKPDGEMILVFRPELQVFATPLAGGPAKIAAVTGHKR